MERELERVANAHGTDPYKVSAEFPSSKKKKKKKKSALDVRSYSL